MRPSTTQHYSAATVTIGSPRIMINQCL